LRHRPDPLSADCQGTCWPPRTSQSHTHPEISPLISWLTFYGPTQISRRATGPAAFDFQQHAFASPSRPRPSHSLSHRAIEPSAQSSHRHTLSDKFSADSSAMDAPDEQTTPFSTVTAQTNKLQRVRYVALHLRQTKESRCLRTVTNTARSITKRSSTSRRLTSSTAGSAPASPSSSSSCACSLRKAGTSVSLFHLAPATARPEYE